MNTTRETERTEAGRTWREWEFPGGHKLTLYVSVGHRASVSLVDKNQRIIFYREYAWHEADMAREHAEGIASLGYTVAVAVMSKQIIIGEKVA